jgi:hypothetical protein
MFDFTKLDITDEDIAFLLKIIFGFSFNDGQKKIIDFLE